VPPEDKLNLSGHYGTHACDLHVSFLSETISCYKSEIARTHTKSPGVTTGAWHDKRYNQNRT
jgi:hypothetical protein